MALKKVLMIGFTPIQFDLARKFVAFRNLAKAIELLPEQQSSVMVDAYVINGDVPDVAARLPIYTRVNPQPVLAVGNRAILGATSYVAGSFKQGTVDQLAAMLGLARASAPAQAAPSNVLSFPAPAQAERADILVVDDSEIVRRTMQQKIREYGQLVDVAASGDDAMAMLLNKPYRLIFLDVMMPGVDGFEVCKRIKRSREYKSVAVYMLTSKDGMFDKVKGSMAGCDGYLVKPLESRKLRAVLDIFFDRPSLVASSQMSSSQGGSAELNEAERAALEGVPPPAAQTPLDWPPEPPAGEYRTTNFAQTVPASLMDIDAVRKH